MRTYVVDIVYRIKGMSVTDNAKFGTLTNDGYGKLLQDHGTMTVRALCDSCSFIEYDG